MARTTRCLAGFGFLITVLTVAGCPFAPQLIVSPQSLHFDPASTVKSFRIANGGGGAINYTVVEELDWIDVAPSDPAFPGSKGLLTGTVTTDPAFFDVTINRSVLQPGQTFTGVVEVRTDAGDINVNVSASIAGPASYTVSATSFDFGFDRIDDSFTIRNTGSSTLQWNATVEPGADWLTIGQTGEFGSSISDSIGSGGTADVVNMRVDRTGLPAGEYTAVIDLNTNVSNTQITVTMEVPSFVINPLMIDFGAVTGPEAEGVNVSNQGEDPINLTFVPDTTDGGDWLTVQPSTLTVQPGSPQVVLLQVDPAGLDTGDYTRNVVVTDVDTGFSQTITVTMERVGFSLTPNEIDFGLIEVVSNESIQLTNEGQSPLDWQLDIPAGAPWLSADVSSGTLAAQEVLGVTLFADPSAVEPGSYETTITVTHENGSEDIVVSMAKARPPALEVSSRTLSFGESSTSQFLGVIHAGDSGDISWSIDTAGFPAWLSITTTDSRVTQTGTVFSGTLTPTDNNRSHGLTVRVRRDLASPTQVDFSHTITVVGSGAVSTSIDVAVTMTVAPEPEIQLTNTQVDDFGVDFINIPTTETTGGFIIENVGDAQLEWNIDVSALPNWLTAISPARGTLDPQSSAVVTVTISREDQPFGPLLHTLTISSNDPDREAVSVVIESQVPKVIRIGVRGDLSFGAGESFDFFEVANIGDPETILNFRAVPNKEWVSLFPETGASEGTDTPTKDWKELSVAIDRSQLTESAASATITIFAFEIVEGEEVPREDIPPVEWPVTVEANSLTIEVGPPRVRAPSLVRYEMIMRNLRSQVIDFEREAEFAQLSSQFNISENGESLQLNETNQFVQDGDNLSTNLMILLDYSNSMVEAALGVEDPAITGAADPLQALYESALIPFIEGLPDRFRVGLAVFNERRTPAVLCPVSYENIRPVVETEDAPVFISDKAGIISRLQSVSVIDHGASEIYPAMIDGINALANEEDERVMFDDTDIRALLVVTDGQTTTPSGVPSVGLTDVLDRLTETRVRCYPLGWGNGVLANPLLQMASVTGGHYYSTKTVRFGEADRFGRIPRVPVASELRRWLSASTLDSDAQTLINQFGTLDVDGNAQLGFGEAVAGIGTLTRPDFDTLDLNADGLLGSGEITEALDVLATCGQTISKDLQSFITLKYVTLNEESSVNVEVKLTFDDENDNNSPCLPEDQGEISSSFAHGPLDFEAIAGDVPMGQISVRTEGVDLQTNTATLTLRAEYVPRNITRLQIRIAPAAEAPNTVAPPPLQLINATEGGVIPNWNVTQAGDVYEISSPDGTPLRYGLAGDLFRLTYQNVNFDFVVRFTVEAPVFDPDNRESKYFAITDYFEVSTEPRFAPGLPQPEVRTDALVTDMCPFTIDLGSDTDLLTLNVHNIGANHFPTDTRLYFLFIQEAISPEIEGEILAPQYQFLAFNEDYEIQLEPDVPFDNDLFDQVLSSEVPRSMTIPLDRTIASGPYIARARFDYLIKGGNLTLQGDSFYIVYTVTEPQLILDTNNLDFGANETDLALIISMEGQGSLEWSVDAAQFPKWLSMGKTSDTLSYDPNPDFDTENENIDTVNVSIDRSDLVPGDYIFDLVVTGTYVRNVGEVVEMSEIVEITMTVAP